MGDSDEAPYWVGLLDVAAEWGMAPWRIEEEASKLWLDRRNALRRLVAEVQQANVEARESRADQPPVAPPAQGRRSRRRG